VLGETRAAGDKWGNWIGTLGDRREVGIGNARAELVLVTGGPGSGRHALAGKLAAALGAAVLHLCVERSIEKAPPPPRLENGAGTRQVRAESLLETLKQWEVGGEAVVLDDLANWVAARLEVSGSRGGSMPSGSEAVLRETELLLDTLRRRHLATVALTREVGWDVVPDRLEDRLYRDTLGWVNQAWARTADAVWLTVAGVPFRLK